MIWITDPAPNLKVVRRQTRRGRVTGSNPVTIDNRLAHFPPFAYCPQQKQPVP